MGFFTSFDGPLPKIPKANDEKKQKTTKEPLSFFIIAVFDVKIFQIFISGTRKV
jgi:hypothetical protein